jgi:ribonuclease P protein component
MSKLPVLKKNIEFQRVYSRGRYSVSKFLVVYVLSNNSDKTRVGITTSKKVGKAVNRNRIRRLIKENLRLLSDNLVKGVDLVIVARQAEDEVSFKKIGQELKFLLKKLNLLKKENSE